MAGRGVHEPGAGIVGDVIAGEQRHVEVRSPAATPRNGCAQRTIIIGSDVLPRL